MGKRSKAKKRGKVSKRRAPSKGSKAKPRAEARAGTSLLTKGLEAALPRVRQILTALFLFGLPLIIYIRNTQYAYTKIAFALFFISLLLLLWILEMILKRSYSINLTSLFFPALLLIIVAALSMINSSSIGTSLQSLALLVYFFLFYLFLTNTVKDRKGIHLLLGSILLSAFLAAAYGLSQHYGYELFPKPHRVFGWKARMMISTVGNPHYLGGFLVFLFIPSLILLFQARRRLLKLFTLLALGLIYAALIPINSYGAWASLIISALFLLGGMIGFKLFRIIRENKGWVIALIVLIGAVILLESAPGPLNSVLGFSQESQAKQSNRWWEAPLKSIIRLIRTSSAKTRAEDWWVGWEMFKDHPILGVGLGNYKIKFLPYKAKFLTTERGEKYIGRYIRRAAQAHSEYVQIAAEMGVLGILATGLIIFAIFWSAFKSIKRSGSPGERFLILALLSGVVAFLAHSLVSFPLHLPASSLNLVLLLGILNSKYFNQEVKTFKRWKVLTLKQVKIGKPAIWIIASLALALTISVTTLTYRDFLADVALDKGERELRLGRYWTAKDEFERSEALDFQPRSVLYWLGAIYRKLGEGEERPDLREQSLELFEESLNHFVAENTYLQLAALYLESADYEKASNYLDQLLAMDPEPTTIKPQAQYLRAMIYTKRDDLEAALSMLKEITAQYKEFERAYALMGEIYLKQGEREVAVDNLNRALSIVKKNLDRANQRLAALRKRGWATIEEYSVTQEIDALERRKEQLEEILKAILP